MTRKKGTSGIATKEQWILTGGKRWETRCANNWICMADFFSFLEPIHVNWREQLVGLGVPKVLVHTANEGPVRTRYKSRSGSHLCIPINENVQFPYFQKRIKIFCLPIPSLIYISVRDFQDRSVYFAAVNYVDRSWKYINRSQTRECGNWDWGRAIPRKEIHKMGFPLECIIHECHMFPLFHFVLEYALVFKT
jgi:hypothetical protein